jgi:hypothetical protein
MTNRPTRRRPVAEENAGAAMAPDLRELGQQLAETAESLRDIGLALAQEPKFLADLTDQPGEPVAALKVFLPDERLRIRLQDLIDSETQKLIRDLGSQDLGMGIEFSNEEVDRRLNRYADLARPVGQLLAVGGYWGSLAQAKLWSRAVQAVGNAVPGGNGLNVWLELRFLPAAMLLYAAGVNAVAGGNLAAAARILHEPKVREPIATQPAALVLVPNSIVPPQVANLVASLERHYTPGSDYIHDWLRPLTSDLIIDDDDYSEIFDRWEYLFGLAYLDLSGGDRWAPVGRIAWRRRYREGIDFGSEFLRDLEQQGTEWGPLQAGLFARDPQTARAALERYEKIAAAARSTVF